MKLFNQKKKTLLSIALILATLLPIFSSIPSTAQAASAGTYNDENLITNVSNPTTLQLSFYLNVPAGQTVNYKIEMIPHVRMGSLDTVSGSYTNSGKSKVSKKITVYVDYISSLYTITASYKTGPARYQKTYTDTDNAVSEFKNTIYTNTFVWTESNIRKYQAGELVKTSLVLAGSIALDVYFTKGKITSTVGKNLIHGLIITFDTVSMASDLIDSIEVAKLKDIMDKPILPGWGYKLKLVPYSGGYHRYLMIYDEFGRYYTTVTLEDHYANSTYYSPY